MKQIQKCHRCELCLHTKPVNGYGDPDADIMFIIDNPDYYDIKNNIPLSEHTGVIFNKLLSMINLERDNVYTTCLVKGRPVGGSLKVKNVMACKDYLADEIAIVNPKLIIILGSKTLNVLLNTKLPINTFANKMIRTNSNRIILVSYNPSFILRDVKNHGIYVRDFINIYKVYTRYINSNFKHFDNNLHQIVKDYLDGSN